MVSGRLSVALHPLGAAALGAFGAVAASGVFTVAAGYVRPRELRLPPPGPARRPVPHHVAAAPVLFGILLTLMVQVLERNRRLCPVSPITSALEAQRLLTHPFSSCQSSLRSRRRDTSIS